MKKQAKLLTILIVTLAFNATGKDAEAKRRKRVKKTTPAAATTSKVNAPVAPETAKASATAAVTEPTTINKYVIRSISFRGLTSLKEDELKASLPLKSNDSVQLPGAELTETMQYLWKLNRFSDISVEQELLGDNGAALHFVVTELPVLDEIVIEGNKEYDRDELLKNAGLVTGKQVYNQDFYTALAKIEKLYASKGYLTASAEFREEKVGNNHVKLLFHIVEGPQVCIEKITFHGNNAFPQKKLRNVFEETVQNSWWRKILGTPKLDPEKFADDKNLLIEFYRNNGYRDARLLNDTITYTKDKKGILLDIYIDEGKKYHIRNITWSGNTKEFATTAILSETFGIKPGDTYNSKQIQQRLNYSQDNSDVSSIYLDRGYLSFRANLQETVINPDMVDLAITMNEGEQYQIHLVNIKGNTKTKDHVIRRELYTVPGDMFSRKNLVRSVRELSMLNYFDPEQIAPDVDPNPENNTVNLTYNVAEKQTDTFNASIGYSTTGFTGALGVTFNNFSLKDIFNGEAYRPLPHGDRQQLGFQWQFGNYNYNTLSLSFTEPWAFGEPTTVGFSAFKTHRAYDYTNDNIDNPTVIDQYGTTLTVGRRLTWPDDYTSISAKLKYLHSNGGFLSFIDYGYTATNMPDKADEVSIAVTLTRNSIDSPIYPRHGSKNSVTGQLAGGILPGTVDFYKLSGSSSWYFPLTKNVVWNLSTQHGFLATFNDTNFIPYTEYFYMGGSGLSVLPTIPLRGYEDRSLGTILGDEASSSSLYAGRYYSKLTTELRYPISMSQSVSIFGLTFLEAGGLWESKRSISLSGLKKSAGVGLRIFMPILGQIGLDYGYGFDAVQSIPGKSEQGWSFLFSFGNSLE